MNGDNFFLGKDVDFNFINAERAPRRLNDYDYNILQEDAYKDVKDELFKLEYRISKLEEELKILDGQIQSARDIGDYDSLENLSSRKRQIQNDLLNSIKIYNEKGLSSKISGGLFNTTKNRFQKVKNALKALKILILPFLPAKFSAVEELKQSLSKLESINKNVDELMTMQTPYGEAGSKYEQLSKYISRANALHVRISKSLK